MKIGDTLIKLRKKAGFTQDEISKQIGVAQNTYSQYENDKIRPEYETLVKIANLYGCSTDYLLGRYKDE
jgi:transcriptional regulator with XRE-family HTH domain